jgi:hypothetical protein
MEAFQRRIQSIQAELEKVIEGQIFKRVLNANGLDVHVIGGGDMKLNNDFLLNDIEVLA